MINDAELSHKTGKLRNKVHDPVERTAKARSNSDERDALESSMRAAREAYLSGYDPTNGATHLKIPTNASRSNWKFKNGTPEGLTLSTQSGPYNNSFVAGDVPSHVAWINTYFPDENDKKIRKKR
jgi:hypothetical protein